MSNAGCGATDNAIDAVLIECQDRWEGLAKEDARFFIWSTERNQSEVDFRQAGLADFTSLVVQDPLLDSLLPPHKSLDILEIGCGIGRMSEFFSDGFRSIGAIDISAEMIRMAKERLADKKNITFRVTDGKSIPFKDDSFDFAFSFIVFQHIPSCEVIEKLFHESNRVLRKGGIFKVQLRGRELPDQAKGLWYYGVHYDLKGALRLAEATGFETLKYEGVGERYFWLWLRKK